MPNSCAACTAITVAIAGSTCTQVDPQRAEPVDPGRVDVEPLPHRLGDAEHDPVDDGRDQDAEDRHHQVDLDADDADHREQQDGRRAAPSGSR